MFFLSKKYSDEQINGQLELLIAQVMKAHNLSRDDAISFVKGVAITKLPFLRKKSINQHIDNLLASK